MAPVLENNRSLGWLTDKLTAFTEGKTPLWWWILFLPAAFCATVVLPVRADLSRFPPASASGAITMPVMWGWDIINFVWWVGVAHAGTLISALLFLTRQHWRTTIGRTAEAMTVFSVMMAGLYPAIHVGRAWFDWFMFPIPTYERHVAAIPFAADVGRVCREHLSDGFHRCSGIMGLIPDLAVLRDRSKTRMRKFIFGLFALGWTGSARHWHNYEKAYLILSRPGDAAGVHRQFHRRPGLLPRRKSPAGMRPFSRSISWSARCSAASAWCWCC